MAAKRKDTRRRAAPPPPPTPTITGILTDRLGPWAALAVKITAIAASVTLGVTIYTQYLDGPVPVSHRALKTSIDGVKIEVGAKIGETKTEVLSTANKNTDEVRTDVGTVKKQVDAIARKQDQTKITLLELQARTLFQQKTQLTSSLNSIRSQLADKPKDPAFLRQRESEVESIIKYVDRETEAVQTQLTRARQGE